MNTQAIPVKKPKPLLLLPEIRVLLISLAHGVNDLYAAFLPTFIPYVKANLGLDYALSGTLSLIVGFCHIVIQPVVGYLSDRIRRPWLIAIGPLLSGLGAIMIPNAGSYLSALAFAALWGVGSALYHPQGSGGVGYVSKPERLPLSLTVFNIFGTLGVVVSPVVAVSMVKWVGYGGLWVALFPPLLLALLIALSMPVLRDSPDAASAPQTGFLRGFLSMFWMLSPLWAISFIRDIVFQGVRFFLPLKLAAQGGSLDEIGLTLFLVTLGGTLTMIPVERLARRVSFKRILTVSMLIGSLCLAGAAIAQGLLSTLLYVLGVSSIYATLPLTVVMAQTLLPHARSVASSVVMGLAWGTANAALYPLGMAADHLGIQTTMMVFALLPLIAPIFLLTPHFRRLR